jgi:hypothetical protein
VSSKSRQRRTSGRASSPRLRNPCTTSLWTPPTTSLITVRDCSPRLGSGQARRKTDADLRALIDSADGATLENIAEVLAHSHDPDEHSLLFSFSFSLRGQPRLHRLTTSRTKSTCPMGSVRKALRAAEAPRFSSARSPTARSCAATCARAQLQCLRLALMAGRRLASPTRLVGTGCGLRAAALDSAWVPVTCGYTTRQAASCSRPSISQRPIRRGRPGSSTTWPSRVTRCM